jgi:uridine kinase
MLLRAAQQLNIDLGASFMVGDRTVDLAAGHSAGVCVIGVRTGYGCADGLMTVEPDFLCDDLLSATMLILQHQSFLDPAARLAEQIATSGVTMVAVGGLARTGKSVFAHLLRWQLRRRGRGAEILHLDDFLRPKAERKALPRVGDRYDTAAIAAALAGASRRTDTTLIAEGVPALALPAVRDPADRRIYVAIDEALRRDRFLALYRERGYDERQAQALYDERDVEERATISASSVYADITVTNEL